jgi:hypothetical protein
MPDHEGKVLAEISREFAALRRELEATQEIANRLIGAETRLSAAESEAAALRAEVERLRVRAESAEGHAADFDDMRMRAQLQLEAERADHDEFGQYTRAEALQTRLATAEALLRRHFTDESEAAWEADVSVFLSTATQPAASAAPTTKHPDTVRMAIAAILLEDAKEHVPSVEWDKTCGALLADFYGGQPQVEGSFTDWQDVLYREAQDAASAAPCTAEERAVLDEMATLSTEWLESGWCKWRAVADAELARRAAKGSK